MNTATEAEESIRRLAILLVAQAADGDAVGAIDLQEPVIEKRRRS